MGRYSLAEAPSGLIHHVQLIPASSLGPERGVTSCGRDVDFDRWTRIRMYDEAMFGKGPSAIRKMIDSALVCERCFG